MAEAAEYRQALDRLSDWRWRLNNLYWIEDKEGHVVPFRMNEAQESLFDEMHYLNVILKARQLGFSTFIVLFMLDVCIFNSHTRAGIIDATIDDAKLKLGKVKFAHARLPDPIRAAVPVVTENAFMLEFGNGSSISVGTSHRGGTLQYLHISEFGKICAKYPEKAREIVTGALNTIQAGQVAWIESTAEGQEGRFFDICQDAQAKDRIGTKLTPLDFKFHFRPWWKAPEYAIDPEGVAIPAHHQRYFERLEKEHGIKTTPAQRAWYVKKAATQLDDMKREYPSTPEEAFEASVEGAIFGAQMEAAELEGRIGAFPAIEGVPVHTFWDIGRRDYNSIWFAQVLFGPRIRVVGFYQNCMTGMPHYAAKCREMFEANGWVRGDNYFPHDAKVTEWGSDRSRIELLMKAGVEPTMATELELHDGINAARATLALCEFDEAGTAEGRKMLKNYRWEWDERLAAFKTGSPRHDINSHGADAFRTLATGWRAIVPAIEKPKPKTDLIYQVVDGRLTANMSPREMIEHFRKKRSADADD